MVNIAIFVSGSGSNCENIIRYFETNEQVNIALVISNRVDAYALKRAKNLNVPSLVLPKVEFNNKEKVLKLMADYHIDFVVLAGFLLMIPNWFITAYQYRMINLHPALLPKFGGIGMYGHHVHEAVRNANETETGMTIHWVSNICDGGKIIEQFRTPITPEDTPEDIAAKEHILEMEHFPQVIEMVLKEEGLIK
ncbi:phosphoribosylglycinamide formyltransferase [Prevotella aurantiaca JCM 15754]|uniref:phosphoribosylglycinamide formyltransferase n=1 Tax=Prevotella aurantiaca TaxID=596085 RepID=UPI0004695A1B|nr:phosphoribosylglycinamide formyltransferase [Prevotella aurantiaca]